jgi:hypothetical protein
VTRGKYDSGYSFRSGDFTEGDSFKRRQHPARQHPQPAAEIPAPGEEQQSCHQGEWCYAATRDPEGQWHPAKTFQAFCPACRGRIATCLTELPAACLLLSAQIGDRPKTGKAVRVPPGPREPIRLDIDALVRETATALVSWHTRVAQVARLTRPRAKVTRPVEAVRDAEKALSPRLDALLALDPAPMLRVLPTAGVAEKWAEDIGQPDAPSSVQPGGEARMHPTLGGVAAGKEILSLHYRARSLLGEIRAKPELYDGVPCRECEEYALVQAEPPSDPKIPAAHSWCTNCGATMGKDVFDAWVKLYESWARAAPDLTCRRCEQGNHDRCKWGACACRRNGHAGHVQ